MKSIRGNLIPYEIFNIDFQFDMQSDKMFIRKTKMQIDKCLVRHNFFNVPTSVTSNLRNDMRHNILRCAYIW